MYLKKGKVMNRYTKFINMMGSYYTKDFEKEKKNINKEDLKFFLESLGENLEEGKTNFPIFVFYNNKNKLSISPQAIDPLDILNK